MPVSGFSFNPSPLLTFVYTVEWLCDFPLPEELKFWNAKCQGEKSIFSLHFRYHLLSRISTEWPSCFKVGGRVGKRRVTVAFFFFQFDFVILHTFSSQNKNVQQQSEHPRSHNPGLEMSQAPQKSPCAPSMTLASTCPAGHCSAYFRVWNVPARLNRN